MDVSSTVKSDQPPSWEFDLQVPGTEQRVKVDVAITSDSMPPQPVIRACLIREEDECSKAVGVPIMGSPFYLSLKSPTGPVDLDIVVKSSPDGR
ncbi:hypothetical protein L6R53_11750 [Myxococcota bacterium]|nr:hypothetical protein [Myxococcota bacterium]